RQAYERALFFLKDSAQLTLVSIKTGDCYFNEGDYKGAYEYYTQAEKIAADDSIRLESRLLSIRCLLMHGQFAYSVEKLAEIENEADSGQLQRIIFYKGVAFLGLDELDSARNSFHFLVRHDPAALTGIDVLFDQYKRSLRNPQTAMVMSVFLPGAGQLYAGDERNAVNSFLLVASFAGVAYGITLFYPIDFALVVLPGTLRYYRGGIREAGRIAEERNERAKSKLLQELTLTL
nr:hypothetical protein [Bacteroidota bacterium]